MDYIPFLLLLAVSVLVAAAPALLPLLRTARAAARVALDSWERQSRTRDVLELAIRARLLVRPTKRSEYRPQFWIGVEYDSMPERQLLNICAAYQDLRLAGLPHDAVVERLEIWRSRFGEANLDLRHASLDDYLRYRIETEYPTLGRWPSFLIAWQRRICLRHARLQAERQRARLEQLRPHLRRKLYTLRIQHADVALDDSTQVVPIGWTDLERYLESDTCAVRVIDGDEVWNYSTPRSAGLALVRDGRILELSELADFTRRQTPRPRRNSGR